MYPYKKIFLKLLFCFSFGMFVSVNLLIAQSCSGSWALQRPLPVECISGTAQWIGWQNSGNPAGCPINPVYTGVQTNTFTFDNPVSIFSIDFIGIDGAILCARIEIKINGIFYPLTASNLSPLAPSPTCVTGSFTYFTVTSDGYITVSTSGGAGLIGRGRITISNVNAISVTVSTNDGSGTMFSNPFNCTTVPLKLESFNGKSNDCKALLDWRTGIEFNVKNIEIQRSEDGVFFYKAGEVNPKGSDSQYSFITDNYSDAYFRLKIIDLDGRYDYSRIIFIKSSCNKNNYSVIPNPASKHIEIIGLKNTDRMVISDMQGRILMKLNTTQNNKINIQQLPSGMYIIKIFNDNSFQTTLKLVKN